MSADSNRKSNVLDEHVDVLIVGAGISGIGAAYHLQTACPKKSYQILEARPRLGGTWDLFRYPGIRSDSDMYTLGYAFYPWKDAKAIADGPSILAYLQDTAREFGIDRKIRYQTRVVAADWSSAERRWHVTVETQEEGRSVSQEISCSFLFMCAGYYRYDAGYTPDFAGIADFEGSVVHPQHWDESIEYRDKRVVVIGSGATAVTIVPEMAKTAQHVVMLQRSPTYIFSAPSEDPIAAWLRKRLPAAAAYQLTRWKQILIGIGFYSYSRRYPARTKEWLVRNVKEALQGAADAETHFSPSYDPWDQRVCLVPDSDLFESIRSGKSSVVTDHIERFTKRGLLLRSGQELEADLVVTATGLQLEFLGGMQLSLDGAKVNTSSLMTYKGMMFGGVPNLAMSVGYTNASWTLKVDLTCAYVCRLLGHMDRYGYSVCEPQPDPTVEPAPIIDFSSGYVQRALDWLPKQGTRRPWRVYQNYILDWITLQRERVDDSVMQFR